MSEIQTPYLLSAETEQEQNYRLLLEEVRQLRRLLEKQLRFQHRLVVAMNGVGAAFGAELGVEWDRLNSEMKKDNVRSFSG